MAYPSPIPLAEDTQQSLAGIMVCPNCGNQLSSNSDLFTCKTCDHTFEISENIPRMFVPNNFEFSRKDVTEDIKAFYEETPFPNYDDLETTSDLVEKARGGVFIHMLDQQLPPSTVVLECGCGTGQLTNFLSIANRSVIGTDICLNSLRLGENFRSNNNLGGAYFMQMNLFRPVFKQGIFDLVICNGVLHHTADPKSGLARISKLVRPGGFMMIGLYHAWGRIPAKLRRKIFHVTGDKFLSLDSRNVNPNISEAKRQAWFLDQYKNPHESHHTITELIRWLKDLNLEFVRSLPSSIPGRPFTPQTRLFEPEPSGTKVENIMSDMGCLLTRRREGENGFFTVIARRPDNKS
ncbi:MAG: class I SAM-dependent methyltransferase [Gammaproteobacteria bacterium]|nr:class I SAM-dependent methyltransferase [Gammaproteobacteria bacterium]